MTGTILPPRETAVLRGVAKSAAVLIALMFIERLYANRASSEMEIAGVLQFDLRTVRRQLAGLSAAGLVTAHGADRWMLTPEGRGTLFGETLRDPHLSIEESEILLLEPEISAQNVHQIEDRLIVNSTKNVESSSSDQRSTKCADVAQILRAAAELFDAEVMVNDMILRRDPEYVLGWVAKAWNDFSRTGSTLRSPAGLVYKRLCELEPLPVMYQKNPARGLPPRFLFELGLLSEAEANTRAEAQEQTVPVNYSGGAFVDLLGGKEMTETETFEGWRSIVHQLPEIKGVAFHSSERVEVSENVMRVFLKELAGNTRVRDANAMVSGIASSIYADITGNPSARVEFVEEVE